MVLATLDYSDHFVALGNTKGEAQRAMQAAWRKHRAQTGASDRWADVRDDVNYAEIQPGQCLRDGSLLAESRA